MHIAFYVVVVLLLSPCSAVHHSILVVLRFLTEKITDWRCFTYLGWYTML